MDLHQKRMTGLEMLDSGIASSVGRQQPNEVTKFHSMSSTYFLEPKPSQESTGEACSMRQNVKLSSREGLGCSAISNEAITAVRRSDSVQESSMLSIWCRETEEATEDLDARCTRYTRATLSQKWRMKKK